MGYTVLEHSSSELENWVTADKTVGSGCIRQNKCIRTIRNGKMSLSTNYNQVKYLGKSVSLSHIMYTEC